MNYKITDKNGKTHGDCQWGENVKHKAESPGNTLCSDQVIHYYDNPYLAVFANPIHGNYDPATMLLWEFQPKHKINGDALKSACKEGTTLRCVPLPIMTTEQQITIAIKCAMSVHDEPSFVKWATDWLTGKDRSAGAAAEAPEAAAWAAEAAAGAAAWAAKVDVTAIIKEVMQKERGESDVPDKGSFGNVTFAASRQDSSRY